MSQMYDIPAEKTVNSKACLRRVVSFSVVSAVFFYLLDQLTKELIVRFLPLGTRKILIPGFFNLTSVRNKGAAWGMFYGQTWFLLLVSFAALAGILFFFRKLTEGYSERVFGLFLVISGIIGNCTDRIVRGEVVDFLEFHLGRFYWPSFNVADSCITIGVISYIISSLFRPERSKK